MGSSMLCPHCNVPCRIKKFLKYKDELSWRCSKNSRHNFSIRSWSIFSRSQLYIPDVMQFVYGFSQNISLLQMSINSGVSYRSTGVEWSGFIREVFKECAYVTLRDYMLHGEVEIDESLFGRRCKYHRGRQRGVKIWVLGMVERATNMMLLFPVDNRNARTLTSLIRKNVAPGSRIYTDSWAGYASLNTLGYEHFTVCHKHTFKQTYKHTQTGQVVQVHTNQIEGAWNHAKGHFRKINGTSVGNFEAHLAEILYRNHKPRGPLFQNMLNTIKKIFPLDRPPIYTYPTPLFSSWHPEEEDQVTGSYGSDEDEVDDEGDNGMEEANNVLQVEERVVTAPPPSKTPKKNMPLVQMRLKLKPVASSNTATVTSTKQTTASSTMPNPQSNIRATPLRPNPSETMLNAASSRHARRTTNVRPTPSATAPNPELTMMAAASTDGSTENTRRWPYRFTRQKTPPHQCPPGYAIQAAKQDEVLPVASKVHVVTPRQPVKSSRGRTIKPRKRSSFVLMDSDSDFV